VKALNYAEKQNLHIKILERFLYVEANPVKILFAEQDDNVLQLCISHIISDDITVRNL
jgi:hypothetical protein